MDSEIPRACIFWLICKGLGRLNPHPIPTLKVSAISVEVAIDVYFYVLKHLRVRWGMPA